MISRHMIYRINRIREWVSQLHHSATINSVNSVNAVS